MAAGQRRQVVRSRMRGEEAALVVCGVFLAMALVTGLAGQLAALVMHQHL
jgi:hypothetical protein